MNSDARQVRRESLFLLAQLRVDGHDTLYRVKVRNLSSRGLMAEGPVEVVRGASVSVELRDLGWIEGTVAWRQDNRFGIALLEEIDPQSVRFPASENAATEAMRPARPATTGPAPSDPAKLRKF
jgi:hypothetical protein